MSTTIIDYDPRKNAHDLYIWRGETFTLALAFTVNDAIFPLTGYTAKMQIRDTYGGIIHNTFDSAGNGIVVDEAGGTITLTITPAQTAAMSFLNAVYDLAYKSPGGDVKPLLAGAVKISQAVTVGL